MRYAQQNDLSCICEGLARPISYVRDSCSPYKYIEGFARLGSRPESRGVRQLFVSQVLLTCHAYGGAKNPVKKVRKLAWRRICATSCSDKGRAPRNKKLREEVASYVGRCLSRAEFCPHRTSALGGSDGANGEPGSGPRGTRRRRPTLGLGGRQAGRMRRRVPQDRGVWAGLPGWSPFWYRSSGVRSSSVHSLSGVGPRRTAGVPEGVSLSSNQYNAPARRDPLPCTTAGTVRASPGFRSRLLSSVDSCSS